MSGSFQKGSAPARASAGWKVTKVDSSPLPAPPTAPHTAPLADAPELQLQPLPPHRPGNHRPWPSELSLQAAPAQIVVLSGEHTQVADVVEGASTAPPAAHAVAAIPRGTATHGLYTTTGAPAVKKLSRKLPGAPVWLLLYVA